MLRSMSARPSRGSRKSQSALRRACGAVSAFEPLETRRLLSAINWVNKGAGPGILDTDDFNAVFGANATVARTIVQRAVDDWERVITNFNGFLGRNSFDVNIDADFLGSTTAADCLITSFDGLLKPQAADIRIDNDAAGGGWYFDASPGTANVPDDSDFTSFVTPWVADRPSSSGRDLYRSVLHELGHAMGVSGSSVLLTAPEVDAGDDPLSSDPADRLKTRDVNGDGTPDYTFTTSGGRHLFEGGGGYVGPTHPNEILNPGRAVSSAVARRGLISDSVATLLRDVYAYTIRMPSTINTFYVNLNPSFNTVTVTGDMNANGSDNDVIDIEVSGTAMSFEVNGTDETIEGVEFGAVIVNAGAGNDDIDVDQSLGGKTVIVNAGDGNDTVQIAQQFGDIDSDLGADVDADGGAGTDTITFNDVNDGVGSDTYTITSPAVQKGNRTIEHLLFENVQITGSPQASTYNIDSTSPFYTLDINAGAAADTFNVGDDDYDSRIFGDVDLAGGAGNDELFIEDDNDTGTGDYTLTHNSFSKTAGGELTFSSIGTCVLNASGQGSRINVDLGAGGLSVTVNAGAGDDTLDLGGASNDLDGALASSVTFNGQGGTDKLDLNDAGDSPDPDSYTLSGVSFSKSAALGVLTFNGTELIDLRGNDGANTITVEFGNLLSTQSVTVGGGGGDDLITSLVPGAVSVLPADTNVLLQGGAGTDTVRLSDAQSFSDSYTLTSDTFQAANPAVTSGLITYAAEQFELTTSTVASTIRVDSTAAGTAYDINAEAGDDTFRFGGPARDARNLLGAVTARGGSGVDRIDYNDDGHATGAEYRLGMTFIMNTGAQTVAVSSIESTQLHATDGADTVDLELMVPGNTVTINGHLGDDTINAGFGLWDGGLRGPVTVNGGGGTDALVIDDSADTGADAYTISATQATSTGPTAGTIDYATVESLTLNANTGANAITVNGTFDGDVFVNGGGGADNIDVIDHFANRTVTVDGGAGLDQVRANGDAAGTASVRFDTSQDLAALTMFAGGKVLVAPGGDNLIFTQSLTMPTGTTLDLADNGMILDYTGASPINSIIAVLIGAYNGGTWSGTGITSSTAAANPALNTAIGYAEATDLFTAFPANVGGFAVDNTAVLMKYTYYGDADLNGAVNLQDFNRLAANFGGTPRRWSQGDFDFNNSVNLSDFNKLAANFGQSGLAPDGGGTGAGGTEEAPPSLEDLVQPPSRTARA